MTEEDTNMADSLAEQQEQTELPQVVQSIKNEDTGNAEDAANEGAKEDGADAQDGEEEGRPVTNEQYKALKAITEVVSEYKISVKGNEDYYPATIFRRLPNKRNLPEYYQIISEPSAISTQKGKIQRKSYTGIAEYVRDFALIVHNAQLFNRPNSQPVKDVFQIEQIFKAELKKLVEQGRAKEEEIEFPDLGEIPAATPEPDPVSEEDEEDEDGEDDEEDEEGDDSDGGRKRRRGRVSISGKKGKADDDEDDGRKRRGRPPKVDTPMEARIKIVLKGLRKPKDKQGNARIRHFERLPDKAEHPHYYTEIKEPIALDMIRKKAKRKKYNSLEHFMKDLELMFKNAMAYNVDGSEVFQDAKVLLKESSAMMQVEKQKSDDDFKLDDGRVPLPDGIDYKDEKWKTGDWVHINNLNDVTKPIVAQIYRTWRDDNGQNWINACWYYRPEQTIHQHEKHFYPNEVCKTGQYRDHHIEEVMDRCFVMFFTRYSRGRPRGLGVDKEVYVCESRYNEDKHKFNKIKTWASCLPDEVRDKDYEMDLFAVPRKIKKVPSPIKDELKADQKDDEMPTPRWGLKNAPPIVGGVRKGPRDENQSPPPEPTPPPPTPPPPAPVPAPSSSMHNPYQPRLSLGMSATSTHNPQMPRPTPSMTPQLPHYQSASASPVPNFPRQTSYQPSTPAQTYQAPASQTPSQQQRGTYAPPQQQHGTSYPATTQQTYGGAVPQSSYARPPSQQQNQPYSTSQTYAAPEHRHPEAYVLSDIANESIPKDIRDQFPRDGLGRILFFTKPPVETRHMVSGRSELDKGLPLRHSDDYLEAKAARQELIKERKRKAHDEFNGGKVNGDDHKRLNTGAFDENRDAVGRISASTAEEDEETKAEQGKASQIRSRAMKMLNKGIIDSTVSEYLAKYGDKALEAFDQDQARARVRLSSHQEDAAVRMNQGDGSNTDTSTLLGRDFGTGRFVNESGRYEDDYDNRLPR